MIVRVEHWNRRNTLCKTYGFAAVIVYGQPEGGVFNNMPACDHRLKTKEFLYKRLGTPMHLNYSRQWQNTDSEWLAYKSAEREYTIAVKDTRLLTLMLLL